MLDNISSHVLLFIAYVVDEAVETNANLVSISERKERPKFANKNNKNAMRNCELCLFVEVARLAMQSVLDNALICE